MKTKIVAFIGIFTALYVAVSMTAKIPLIGHIQTDLGYIVFGFALYMLGWKAFIVGALGCVLESLIFSGWIPYGWLPAQIVIGIVCGIVYKKTDKKAIHIITTILMVFIGIGLIKTIIECLMFGIPFEVKFMKDLIAFVADAIPMLIGLLIAYGLRGRLLQYME